MHTLIRFQTSLFLLALTACARLRQPTDERGQATAEYALVLLGAAAVAGLFLAWVTKTNAPGRLLDAVFDKVLLRADS